VSSKGLITVLAGVMAIALIVVGCGSSDEEATAKPIAKAAFLKRADSICAETYKRVQNGYEATFKNPSGGEPLSDLKEIEAYADGVLIPAKEEEVEELRALGVPPGDEDQVEGILAAYEVGIERAEESPRDAVVSSAGVFVKATELAQDYGLELCRY